MCVCVGLRKNVLPNTQTQTRTCTQRQMSSCAYREPRPHSSDETSSERQMDSLYRDKDLTSMKSGETRPLGLTLSNLLLFPPPPDIAIIVIGGFASLCTRGFPSLVRCCAGRARTGRSSWGAAFTRFYLILNARVRGK